jgi:hypothetical protein
MDTLEQLVDTFNRILKKMKVCLTDDQLIILEQKLRLEIGGTNAYYPSKRVETRKNLHKIIQGKMTAFKVRLAKRSGMSVRQLEAVLRVPKLVKVDEANTLKESKKRLIEYANSKEVSNE